MTTPRLAFRLSVALSGSLVCGLLGAMPVAECPQDLRSKLPDRARQTLDGALGVESMAEVNIEQPPRLVVAIVLPKWHFSEEGCSGSKSSEDVPRTLLVWREHGESFRLAAESSRLLWPRATAGTPAVRVFAESGGFVVRQSSNPIRASFSDDFTFIFDQRYGRVRLASREASSLYNTFALFNSGDPESAKLENAKRIHGQVCEVDGYEAAANFLTGKGLVKECKFALPEAIRHIKLPAQPIYLEDLDETPFDRLPFFK